MSESTDTTPPAPPSQTASVEDRSSSESLISQAFIYAMCMVPLAAGILIGAFKYLSPEVASTLAGTALGLVLGNPSQFFFGAAKHSGNQASGTMTTVSGTPPTVTTTTGTQP